MTGCGAAPTRGVTIAVPGDVADAGAVDKGALSDLAVLPACDEHAEHVAKLFYAAAYALDGTVTTAPLRG